MPLQNSSDLYKQIDPDVGQLDRLTQSLISMNERKLARQRQAEMDRMVAEAQASRMQDAEEARQLRLLYIQQKMAALQPRKTETIKGVPDLAARPPMAP